MNWKLSSTILNNSQWQKINTGCKLLLMGNPCWLEKAGDYSIFWNMKLWKQSLAVINPLPRPQQINCRCPKCILVSREGLLKVAWLFHEWQRGLFSIYTCVQPLVVFPLMFCILKQCRWHSEAWTRSTHIVHLKQQSKHSRLLSVNRQAGGSSFLSEVVGPCGGCHITVHSSLADPECPYEWTFYIIVYIKLHIASLQGNLLKYFFCYSDLTFQFPSSHTVSSI